jgi:hypothetical protein
VPTWLDTTVAAAVIAALGYVGKLISDAFLSWRARRAARVASLVELHATLQATEAAFKNLNDLRGKLMKEIRSKQPDAAQKGRSADWIITRAYPEFDDDECDLHAVIRGYTEHALRPLNQSMLRWLERDTYYTTRGNREKDLGELATLLGKLRVHLLLWLAKYEAWIPSNEAHCLVFLGDEEKHGVPFPSQLDGAVRQVLSTRVATGVAARAAAMPARVQEPD